jgi:cytoskeletal protein RodZ
VTEGRGRVIEGRSHRLGDVLREGREAKGVDLTRVERDTKIRERYLSALERGEYLELPGSVYTKGFLRNYGAYLGLDPEYLIDLYRLETTTAVERPRVPAPPRPLAARKRRTFVVTPGAVVAAILTIGVGAFVAYLTFEIINFARTPDLRITDPPGPVSGYTGDSITIRGITAPNATVTVDNLRENPQVEADADGVFEVEVGLVPGSNVVRLSARDPVTQRDSATAERTILVVTDAAETPTPGLVEFRLDEPADGATFTGSVPIRGTWTAGGTVLVQVQLIEASTPRFEILDINGNPVSFDREPPATPQPLTLTAGDDESFEGSLDLAPGTWELEVTADDGDPVVRSVTITAGEGLTAVLEIEGGDSYLDLEEDGARVEGWPSIASDGETVELRGEQDLRIRAGNAGAVRLTVNGITIGVMGEDAQVIEWRVTPTDGE